MNFAAVIFQSTGSGLQLALGQTATIGITNFLFTLVGIWLVDRLGRKVLLWVGALGLSITLAASGYIFYHKLFDGPWALLTILLYVAFFAATVGPIVWVYISEIFPNRSRAFGMGIATLCLWSSNYLNIQFYPILENAIGIHNCFYGFGFINLIFMGFVLWKVKETKGKSLEEIELEPKS
jgi:SP family arabinose:H+ symporter-like MFS transporter